MLWAIFRAKWNTNGSGELVNWIITVLSFKTEKQTVFIRNSLNPYPKISQLNSTFQAHWSTVLQWVYTVGFTNEPNVGAKWSLFNKYGRKSDTKTPWSRFHPTGAGGNRGMTLLESFWDGNQILDSEDEQSAFATKGNKNKCTCEYLEAKAASECILMNP